MKKRKGFVSNSSSCSFVVNVHDLTNDQVDLILHPPKEFDKWDAIGMWDLTYDLSKGQIRGFTIMDNFDYEEFMEKIGVDVSKVKFDREH